MIDIVKYNKRESAYHTFCLLLDFFALNYPQLLRGQNKTLRSRKEYHELLKNNIK